MFNFIKVLGSNIVIYTFYILSGAGEGKSSLIEISEGTFCI